MDWDGAYSRRTKLLRTGVYKFDALARRCKLVSHPEVGTMNLVVLDVCGRWARVPMRGMGSEGRETANGGGLR